MKSSNSPSRKPYVIGITGNIGSGKSVVLQRLRELGALVVDADRVAHAVIDPQGEAFQQVVDAFGQGILDADGRIDREMLGHIVFSAPAQLAKLEQIVHPAVRKRIRLVLAGTPPDTVVAIEAIKLLESGLADDVCDEIWVVTAPAEVRARRLAQDRGMSPEDAWVRIEAQPPEEEKIARADVVIENSGSLEDLFRRVDEEWARVVKEARG